MASLLAITFDVIGYDIIKFKNPDDILCTWIADVFEL
jgi:hypothetical protein